VESLKIIYISPTLSESRHWDSCLVSLLGDLTESLRRLLGERKVYHPEALALMAISKDDDHTK